MRDFWANSEYRKSQSEAFRIAWLHPEKRKQMSEFMTELLKDPVRLQKRSEDVKAAWADPIKRQRFLDGWTEEAKKNHARAIREALAKPENKEKWSRVQKIRWAKY